MPYRPATVAVGWPDGEYAAEILDGETWNGHVIPRFAKSAAEAIVDDQAWLLTRYGEHALGDEMVWDGDVIKVLPRNRPFIWGDAPEVEWVIPDLNGFYHIGSMEWHWFEVV